MRILILNVHSALNLGDDAIMQSTLQMLHAAFPDARLTVAANDPGSWRKYSTLDIVSSPARWHARPDLGAFRGRMARMSLQAGLMLAGALCFRLSGRKLYWGLPEQRRLLQAYYEADLVLSCGGGNFYAHRSLSPGLIWALLTLGFAVLAGNKVAMLPQSVGPIPGRLQRLLARWVLGRVPLIMVREGLSAAFLAEVLHIKQQVVVVPDMAFGFASRLESARSPAPDRTVPLRIGVTVIDRSAQAPDFNRQSSYEEALAALLIRLHQEQGAQIHLFCQCYGPSADQDDRATVRRLHERLKELGGEATLRVSFDDAFDIASAYGEMDLIVGTRMHTGVFALCNQTPVLLIGYQPKARGVMASFGLERYCLDIDDIEAGRLYTLARELLERRRTVSAQIAARLREIERQLRQVASKVEDAV
jgi:colanic acid/amylovoran biosynthesis protein